MKIPKMLLAGVVGLLVIVMAVYLFNHRPDSGREIPALSPRSAGFQNSAEFASLSKKAENYRSEIRRHPEIAQNYVELSWIFLQESRITGNHHEYIPKAQWLINEALRRDPQNFEAAVTKASILLTLHRFAEARELADKAVSANSHNAFAYGVLTDAYLESGEYEKALQACDRMLGIRPDLRSYARASYLRELHGQREAAIQAMKIAADAGVFGQEERAWALYQLGNLYLNRGALDTAAFIFRGIREERPDYPWALSGEAAVKAASKDYPAAIELLVQAMQINPEHAFVEQLAGIYRAMGHAEGEQEMVKKALEAFAQHEKDGWNIDLEYARFCLEHQVNLAEALQRAEREYRRRPENIETLEVYAWALHQSGKSNEALPLIQKALRLNTARAELHYRAGMICHDAGQNELARSYLERALTENPLLGGGYAQQARAVIASLPKMTSVH